MEQNEDVVIVDNLLTGHKDALLSDNFYNVDIRYKEELDKVFKENNIEAVIFNLGNGNGYSVKEVIDVARKVTNYDIKAVVEPRRAGDPAVLIATSQKAQDILGWNPEYDSLEKIITDAWNWHENNPSGFDK